MALQKQIVTLPMVGSDESTDKRLLSTDKLAYLLNGDFTQRGAVRTRNGFSAVRMYQEGLTANVPDARGIFSTGEELCILGRNRLWGYNAAFDLWHDRGPIAPCTARANGIFRDEMNYLQADLDRMGKFIMHAAQRHYRFAYTAAVDEDATKRAIVATVRTVDGHVADLPQLFAESSTLATKPHSPRVAHCTNQLLLFYVKGLNGTNAGTLVRQPYDVTLPGYSSPFNISTNVLFTGSTHRRRYDAIGLDHNSSVAGGYAVAWIDNTDKTIIVRRYTAAHAQDVEVTLGNPETVQYYLVALAESPTPSSDALYVFAVKDGGAGNDVMHLYKLKATDLTTVWGPIAIATLPDSPKEYADNLGVAEGNGRVACTWAQYPTTVPKKIATRSGSVAASSGASADTVYTVYNAIPWVRPFWENDRCHVWLSSAIAASDDVYAANASDQGTEVFEVHWMADLMVNTTNPITSDRQPTFVGLHSVGTAPPFITSGGTPYPFFLGSANHVMRMSDESAPAGNVYRYASVGMSFYQQDSERRHEAVEIECNFAEAPGVALCGRGAAVIGGAMVSWYAGGVTEELGFPVPPVIVVETAVYPLVDQDLTPNPPGSLTLPAGTYTYTTHWECPDYRGHVHRSHPSPPVMLEHSSSEAIKFAYRNTPCSNRTGMPGRDMAVVLYRAATDGSFTRVTRPLRVVRNIATAHYTENDYDFGEYLTDGVGTGIPLYTNGGVELENVAPEGARLPVVAGERLFLADMVRRERVQFSKVFTVVTAAEDVRAPEMNEAFGLAVPSGKRTTAVASVDDKIALFTEDEIYALAGRGPDDAGLGSDFSALQLVSADGGCIEGRSVVAFPGGVLFQHRAGIYQLDRQLGVAFVGAAVQELLRAYPRVTSGVLVTERNQVRFTCNNADATAGIVIVFDYRLGHWFHWKIQPLGEQVPLAGACMHQGVYHVVSTRARVYREDATTSLDHGMTFVPLELEAAWVQAGGQSGRQRVRAVTVLAERLDAHDLEVKLYREFEAEPVDVRTFEDETIRAWRGQPLEQPQVRVRSEHQKSQAFKIRIATRETMATLTGRSCSIAGLSVELGVKPGRVRVPRAQKEVA